MVLTGPLLVVGALAHGPTREWVWGVSAVLDLSKPTVLRSRLKTLRYDAPHLAERFGLFVLIALGESVVAVGASVESGGRLDVGVGAAVVAAFALSCGLWWVYFAFAADAVRHALATAKCNWTAPASYCPTGIWLLLRPSLLCRWACGTPSPVPAPS